jgi:hypothetical protein
MMAFTRPKLIGGARAVYTLEAVQAQDRAQPEPETDAGADAAETGSCN